MFEKNIETHSGEEWVQQRVRKVQIGREKDGQNAQRPTIKVQAGYEKH